MSDKGLDKTNKTNSSMVSNTNDIESTYMNGNSLGCQPKNASEYVQNVLNDWRDRGLGMHFDGAFLLLRLINVFL